METSILTEKDEELWQAPVWYRALSLTERLGARQAETSDISSTPGATLDKALSHLHAWKAQKPFEQGALFVER